MDVLEAIKKRRSIRKYLDVAIEWEKMVHILEAGQYAPSAGNLQDWKFIVVTDKGIKRQIAEACLNQVWMETAPVHMVICSNPEKTLQYYADRGETYAIENCACVAMAMMLEATEHGLDTCWVGAFDESMLRMTLGIPDRAKPMMVLTIGYGDETVPVPPRVVLESLIYLQKYGNRIKNANMVMWDWSLMMEDYAKRGKEVLAKKLEKLKQEAMKPKREGKEGEEEPSREEYERLRREAVETEKKGISRHIETFKKRMKQRAEEKKRKKELKLLKEYE